MTQRQKLIVPKPSHGKMADVTKAAPKTTAAPARRARTIAPLPPATGKIDRRPLLADEHPDRVPPGQEVRVAPSEFMDPSILARPRTMATMEMPVTSFGIFHAQLVVGKVPIQRAVWIPRHQWLEFDTQKNQIMLARGPIPGTGQTVSQRSPWVPNQQDLLASDWSLAKGVRE